MKSHPENEIIRKSIQSVQFSFYTDDDVRHRSVVEVTSPESMDPNNTPLPHGLYDPRMGCFEKNHTSCVSCGKNYRDCPGHTGHVELAVPVWHPLLLDDLVELLRCKCLYCHQWRAPSRQVKIQTVKLCLLYANQLSQLATLQAKVGAHAHKKSSKTPNESVQAMDAFLNSMLQQYKPQQSSLSFEATDQQQPLSSSYHRSLYQSLRTETISLLKSQKRCHRCGAYSPKIRQDSSNKVFQKALSKKLQRLNEAARLHQESAMKVDNDSNADQEADDDESSVEENVNDDPDSDSDDDDATPATTKRDKFYTTAELQHQVQRLYDHDPYLFHCLFGSSNKYFLQALCVPPNRFRPPMYVNNATVEHAQTALLKQILTTNSLVRDKLAIRKESSAYSSWIQLQTLVNIFMDASKDPSAVPNSNTGIRQILERKEGLFRQHMMGKRVDSCCRSVISPDPYIGTNEIGLPVYFASVLTYPTPVNASNVAELRQLVERGTAHPGARWVTLNGRKMDLSKMKASQRTAVAARLMTPNTVVGRQLRDGDYVLMNRQPTLHKPGIMAHRVRMLHDPDQKTIRMHYANCNTYNADYDGDEMNCHFPQNDLARAEAQHIAQTDLQYIVPTDGSPLRGLIQDHVVGGVKMTKKDTFLEKWEYQQLVFAALTSLSGLEVIRSSATIELVPPAVIKPRELWTGKQVVTTLLLHLRQGSDRDSEKMSKLPGISAERKSKTPEAAFGPQQEEHLVLIRDGELLRGVLDKAAFGSTDFSLVHAVYEAYGPEKAGLLLNCFGRLFTAYIQFYAGHSCRVEDLVLTKKADMERRKLVERAYNIGARAAKAWAESEGGKIPIPSVKDKPGAEQPLKPVELASAAAKIGVLLSGKEGKENFAALDGFMQGQLNPLSSDIVKKSLPGGLAVPFPYNTFGIMTTTGAKGSLVNQSQVTCALGQQALEGRRVPRMSSGRTLPSFSPYDPSPRADGFVMDRFLTGIRPQEYYFHCMAGREGLVDTAVKTSRSGYLQRCLIKHLEDLKVSYDYTVRNSEGGIVQFLYGEDSLDPTKASYLDGTSKSFEFMSRNFHSMERHNTGLPFSTINIALKDVRRKDLIERKGDKVRLVKGDIVMARRLRFGDEWKRGSLCHGWHLAKLSRVDQKTVDLRYLVDGHETHGVPITVRFQGAGGQQTRAVSNSALMVKPCVLDPILSTTSRGHRLGSSGACVSERVAMTADDAMDSERLKKIMASLNIGKGDLSSLVGAKFSSSVCAPGEAVGSIAAQSVGEPSTQMTLNTFHLAGSGANVTLGIPRLREIIMTASRALKTPTMSVPLREWVSEKKAAKLARSFLKLSVMDLISGNKGISVTERLENSGGGSWYRAYYVVVKFHPAERIKEAFGLTLDDIAKVVAKNLVPLLKTNMKRELRRSAVDGEVSGEVHGGEASEYNYDHPSSDDTNPDDQVNELEEKDEDEDNDMDEANEEDGVDYRRKGNRASYDQEASSDEEETAAETQDLVRTPDRTSADQTPDESVAFNDSGVPTVKKDSNSIALQALTVEPNVRPVLMVGLVEKAASSTLVRSKKGISEAFVNDEVGRGRCLQTAGANFEELWRLEEVNHHGLMSNDIWAVRCAYGVEAARGNIVEQIRSVFGVYGIEVDPRHLSLIADYMTYDGGFKPMSRIGMEDNASTMLQMSFETTTNFLKKAALRGTEDKLDSPSANIVVGRPIRHGTGAFSVMAPT